MGTWLSEREQRLVAGAEAASAATPVPTQIVSNGEYFPPSQSAIQKKVEGQEIVEAPEEAPKTQIIDLMEALKASLAKGKEKEKEREEKPAKKRARG